MPCQALPSLQCQGLVLLQRQIAHTMIRPQLTACLLQVYPEKGTVSFSAGLHGWAFTLTSFAQIYAKKFGVEVCAP